MNLLRVTTRAPLSLLKARLRLNSPLSILARPSQNVPRHPAAPQLAINMLTPFDFKIFNELYKDIKKARKVGPAAENETLRKANMIASCTFRMAKRREAERQLASTLAPPIAPASTLVQVAAHASSVALRTLSAKSEQPPLPNELLRGIFALRLGSIVDPAERQSFVRCVLSNVSKRVFAVASGLDTDRLVLKSNSALMGCWADIIDLSSVQYLRVRCLFEHAVASSRNPDDACATSALDVDVAGSPTLGDAIASSPAPFGDNEHSSAQDVDWLCLVGHEEAFGPSGEAVLQRLRPLVHVRDFDIEICTRRRPRDEVGQLAPRFFSAIAELPLFGSLTSLRLITPFAACKADMRTLLSGCPLLEHLTLGQAICFSERDGWFPDGHDATVEPILRNLKTVDFMGSDLPVEVVLSHALPGNVDLKMTSNASLEALLPPDEQECHPAYQALRSLSLNRLVFGVENPPEEFLFPSITSITSESYSLHAGDGPANIRNGEFLQCFPALQQLSIGRAIEPPNSVWIDDSEWPGLMRQGLVAVVAYMPAGLQLSVQRTHHGDRWADYEDERVGWPDSEARELEEACAAQGVDLSWT